MTRGVDTSADVFPAPQGAGSRLGADLSGGGIITHTTSNGHPKTGSGENQNGTSHERGTHNTTWDGCKLGHVRPRSMSYGSRADQMEAIIEVECVGRCRIVSIDGEECVPALVSRGKSMLTLSCRVLPNPTVSRASMDKTANRPPAKRIESKRVRGKRRDVKARREIPSVLRGDNAFPTRISPHYLTAHWHNRTFWGSHGPTNGVNPW